MKSSIFIREIVDNYHWIKKDVAESDLKNYLRKVEKLNINLPTVVFDFSCLFHSLSNNEETAWFISIADYAYESESAFKWNAFHLSSLECAISEKQKSDINAFWNYNIPFALSVADGYAYIAYRHSTDEIVIGREPEYEDSCEIIAKSFDEFTELFIKCINGTFGHRQIEAFLGHS